MLCGAFPAEHEGKIKRVRSTSAERRRGITVGFHPKRFQVNTP